MWWTQWVWSQHKAGRDCCCRSHSHSLPLAVRPSDLQVTLSHPHVQPCTFYLFLPGFLLSPSPSPSPAITADYSPPYGKFVSGGNPSIAQMRDIVFTKEMRPEFPTGAQINKVSGEFGSWSLCSNPVRKLSPCHAACASTFHYSLIMRMYTNLPLPTSPSLPLCLRSLIRLWISLRECDTNNLTLGCQP